MKIVHFLVELIYSNQQILEMMSCLATTYPTSDRFCLTETHLILCEYIYNYIYLDMLTYV